MIGTRPSPCIHLSAENNDESGEQSPTAHLETRLKLAIDEANQAIFDYAQKNPIDAGNLGCTVTCAIVFGNDAIIANVGDSRTYLYLPGRFARKSRTTIPMSDSWCERVTCNQMRFSTIRSETSSPALWATNRRYGPMSGHAG